MSNETDRDFYYSIINQDCDLSQYIDHFNQEAKEAREELIMKGSIEKISQQLPVIMEKRFTQLQILNATVEYFEKKLEEKRSYYFKKYMENYQRNLSSRDIEKYINGEEEVVNLAIILNEIALVRNIFVSINKSIDAKSFQINNITKLRTAGLEDARIE